jgi:hypothetical protein
LIPSSPRPLPARRAYRPEGRLYEPEAIEGGEDQLLDSLFIPAQAERGIAAILSLKTLNLGQRETLKGLKKNDLIVLLI